MDSKNLKNPRLADLCLSTQVVTAAVQDIPVASINAGNVELELSNFGENAEVVLAESAGEIATVSVVGTVATLDFASALTDASILRVTVRQDI